MQAHQAELQRLHSVYTKCLNTRVSAFLAGEKIPEAEEAEFCPTEKNSYVNYMRVNLPIQYDNVMRLESTNVI